MSKILLCGYGAIGRRMAPEYEMLGSLDIFDPNFNFHTQGFCISERELKIFNTFETITKHYDFAILCLPTPTIDGKCDTSIVYDMVRRLQSIADVIVIRSTVSVGTTNDINAEFKNVIFCPEFYGTTQHQARNDYLILGGNRKLCNKFAQLYYKIKPAYFKIKFYDNPSVAEMIKYMDNCFLATKVVFCNSFAEACKKAGIEYDDVREGWLMDDRINPSHTIVYEEQPFYDSHCFNKDIPAFANKFNDKFMKMVDEINTERKLTKIKK